MIMSAEEIALKVNDLMHQGFEIPREKLAPGALLFQDLGLDSLDAVDMLVHLEENLAIKVEGERLASIRTLADVYKLVEDMIVRAKNAEREAGEQSL